LTDNLYWKEETAETWLLPGAIFNHLVENSNPFNIILEKDYYTATCRDTVSITIIGTTEEISVGITVEEQSSLKSSKSSCGACVDGEHLSTVAIQYTGTTTKRLKVMVGDGGTIFNQDVSTNQIVTLNTTDWGESQTLSLELASTIIGVVYLDCSTTNGPGTTFGAELEMVDGTLLLDGTPVCAVNGDTTAVTGTLGSTFVITISVSLFPGGPLQEIQLLANGEGVTLYEGGKKSSGTDHLYEGTVTPDQEETGCNVSATGRMSTTNVSFKIMASNTTTGINNDQLKSKLVYSSLMQDQLILSTTDGSGISDVVLYSITGQKVLNETPNTSSVSLSVSHLSPGIYILSVKDSKGNTFNGKVVKK
jgi:hypothetical protein